MASFKQLEKNNWQVSFYCKNYLGENIRYKKRGFKTKKDAENYSIAFKSKYEKSNQDISLKVLMDDFYDYKANGLRESTLKKYKHFMRQINLYFKNSLLKDINELKILKFLRTFDNRPEQQKKLKKHLNMVYDYAVLYYNFPSNIIKRVKLVNKTEIKEREIWTVEEFKTFMECLEKRKVKGNKTPHSLYFNLLYYSGARPGEIAALTLNDIDLTKNTININKTRIDYNTVNPPKNVSSNRTVQIPNKIMNEVRKLVKEYKIFENDFLFTTVKTYQNILNDIIKANNLNPITLHGFRHSHVSLLIHKGIDIVSISKRIGHKNSKITLSTYAHLFDKENETISNMLEEV
ncbi:site-specific integrase [Streptobacillus moniliformis]|uniref:site-specific integrase n=1 Tax=Streptobacillus moniliformis TaxID=34105 RepID=UPI0007E4B1B3|nr:site-specific integrase [Streptobacillus moniliformis]